MKPNILFIAVLVILTGCGPAESNNLQDTARPDRLLQLRNDCEACDLEDGCCCGVWLQPGAVEAEIAICASTPGLTDCIGGGVGNCPSFSGRSYGSMLQSMSNPKLSFCNITEGPFWSYNLSGTSDALVIITCQDELSTPDTIWVQLAPNERRFIGSNTDCELDPC